MNLSVKGHYKATGKAHHFGDKGAYTTKFWIDIDKDDKYPSLAEFEVWKDKVDLTKLSEGDPVTVHFNINGRTYVKKSDGKNGFFQTLSAWKIEQDGSAPVTTPPPIDTPPDDDLPF